MRILYEDNHVIVVEKPVNVPTQADRSRDPDMVTLLKNDLKHRYNKPGNVYLGLVHRLDRPVGGAMVFAKTSKAASRLSDAVRRRRLIKRYLAVVHGKPPQESGTLEHYLRKDRRTNEVRCRPEPSQGCQTRHPGLSAVTNRKESESSLRTADYRKATPDPGAICPYGLSAVWRPEIRISQKPSRPAACTLVMPDRFSASDLRRDDDLHIGSVRPVSMEHLAGTASIVMRRRGGQFAEQIKKQPLIVSGYGCERLLEKTLADADSALQCTFSFRREADPDDAAIIFIAHPFDEPVFGHAIQKHGHRRCTRLQVWRKIRRFYPLLSAHEFQYNKLPCGQMRCQFPFHVLFIFPGKLEKQAAELFGTAHDTPPPLSHSLTDVAIFLPLVRSSSHVSDHLRS